MFATWYDASDGESAGRFDTARDRRTARSLTEMPEAFVLYGQFQRRGITVEAVRGIGMTRRPDEAWKLPAAIRQKMGSLLRDLGFDVERDVWAHDVPQQHVFRLTQRTNEEERREASQERRRGQLQWLEGMDRQ